MESDLSVLQDPEFLIFALSQVSESERPSVLNSIGAEFLTRLELKGSLDDLLHAIKIEEKALEAAPGSSPFRTIILNSLVYRLRMKFERMGSMEDLNRAIETIEQAVQSIPLDYPDMAMCLNNLGNTLKKRFVRTGSMEDLNRAIEIYNQTVQSTSTDDSDRFAMYLNNLGAALRLRFERNGSIEDLNHAVKTTRQAVQLTALGDPRKAMYLSNLGTALRNRFERTGSIEDLNCAIKTNHQAVQLVPPDHFSQGGLLNNLGNALLRRSMTTGSMNDLDHAIDTIDQAVQSTPLDHPALAMHYLNNLGIAVHRRFERTRSLEDLDRAIKTNEQAVHLLPVDHHNWAIFVNNLSSTLLIERFERLGLIEDLDRAIEASEKAVQSVPLDHPQRASCLNQLGNALHRRSKMGATVDLDRAIQTEDRAVQSMALEHPDRAMYLYNLGRLLQSRFESSGSIEDLEGSILAYKQAANSDKAPPFDRLKAGWVCANFLLGQRMLERAKPILEAAVNLLPHLAPRLLKRTDAQFNVSEFANVTARAVSLSVEYDTDDPWKSLQLLELGRGILANLQLEVRSDISALETNHPELARQFQELRDQIDSISKTFEPDGQSICGINSTSDMSETFISYSRRLHQQFDDLVVHIRGLQGFDNFLKGPSEKELRSLAKGGAIVVFNISDIRSDAFLITTDGIRVVNLPLLTSDAILSYATLFLESIDEQDGIQYSRTTRKINSVLKGLWDCGVKAILDELGFTEVPADGQPWPRIWWVGILDRVVSSYAYTVKSLSYAREKAAKVARDSPVDNAIVLAMPTTPGQAPLEFIKEEVKRIKNLLTEASVPVEEMMNATRQQVLSALPQYTIAHFTCHGDSMEDPSASCLLLEDWKETPLTVADLTSLNTEYAKFSFLSACHSSAGRNYRLLDESINLSSAIQLAGFPSVVGTLWQIDEVNAAEVAVDVYTNMLQGGDGLDFERSAESLHKAVRALRERSRVFGKTLPLVWAPYIHIGV